MVLKPTIIGFKHLFRRPVTIQYPFEKLKVSEKYRGVPAVNPDACTACGRCIEVCPNDCTILVDWEGGQRKGNQVPNLYTSRCMFCGLCVEVCPTGARVSTREYELAEYTREESLWSPERMLPLVIDRTVSPIVKAPEINEDECVNCLECKRICPEDAISNIDKGDKRTLVIDYDKCTFCGKCIDICPPQALRYAEKEIKEGMKLEWKKKIPVKDIEVKNYFELLNKKVIESNWCSHCTACIVACPVERIKGKDVEIYEDESIECSDCSLCVRSCPRYDYENPNGLGDYLEVFSAGSKRFVGQDGAMVTELLTSAMEMGIIDTAIVVSGDKHWHPVLRIAHTPEEVTAGLKTKYALADVLSILKLADSQTRKGIGIVGTPCQIEGFRRHAEKTKFFTSKVKLVVGIFCFENFYYKRFYEDFLGGHGIVAKDIERADMKKGVLTVDTKDGKIYEFKVAEFEHYALQGCMICQHFINMTADISVGGSGSEMGFSSVFVRRENVTPIIEYMREKGYIEEAGEEQMEKVLKVNNFMCRFKIKKHPIEPYLEARGKAGVVADGS
ncbi:MAG: Coenzyme F420 hydrogenase/dehydrogenase, beta subunit C-terminal domain [Candidatus Hydrothermarchaeales archaeon]